MKFAAERLYHFPDPRLANEDEILLISNEVNTELLFEAYSFGIFPWPYKSLPILWFSPDPRGVLDFHDLHLPRSLKKAMGKVHYKITYNQCFSHVIEACSRIPRIGQKGSWITEQMIRSYKQFHKEGYAHSVECWMESELVGGLYGIYVAGVFSGESMFYRRDNTSKYCLIHLVEKLKSMGHTWMDIQMVTENLKVLGGKYIPRDIYLNRMKTLKESWSFTKFP